MERNTFEQSNANPGLAQAADVQPLLCINSSNFRHLLKPLLGDPVPAHGPEEEGETAQFLLNLRSFSFSHPQQTLQFNFGFF